jgi:hypothetical protein
MGLRGRKCAACDPSVSARIAALVEIGVCYSEIAAAVGLSKFVISRHVRHSRPDAPVAAEPKDELAAAEEDLDSLVDQLQEQFRAAVATGEAKLALDVAKTLGRQQSEKRRRLIEQRKVAAAASDPATSPTSPAFFDQILRDTEQFRKQQESWGMIECPCCEGNANAMVYPRQIRQRWAAIEAAKNMPDKLVAAPLLPGVPNPNPKQEPMTVDNPPIH